MVMKYMGGLHQCDRFLLMDLCGVTQPLVQY